MTTTPLPQIAAWGARTGLLGGAAMLSVMIFVAVAIGIEPESGAAAELDRFPQILHLRVIENALYGAALVLWVCHGLATGLATWRTAPAAALFGAAILTLGQTIMAAGAVPHLAHLAVATSWQAGDAGAPALWRAVWGLFDALLITGCTIAAAGMLTLGLAVWRAGARRAGPACALFGLAAALASPVAWFDPDSVFVAVIILSLIGFHLSAALWLRTGAADPEASR